MKIVIFGASGGIGHFAVQHALAKGYEVRAFLRQPEKLTLTSAKLEKIQGEISNQEQVEAAIQDCDAVVWCVGVPMERKNTARASLKGHELVFAAMKKYGVQRFIDWSTPSVPFKKDKKSFLTIVPGFMAGLVYTSAKQELIEIANLVETSGLDWTIVRFIAPKDAPFSDKISVGFGDVKMKMTISRENIGTFMIDQIENMKYLHSMPIIGDR